MTRTVRILPSLGRVAFALSVTLSLGEVAVAAQTAAEGAQEDPCARGSWVIAGAASQPDSDRAVFVPEWTATLEAVASCLRAPALADACVVVRGLTDETDFSPSLARAFGSPQAVQLARGQGRALAVQERLEGLGAPPHRVRTAAAVIGAKARGAELRLVRKCLDTGPRDQLARAELEALVDARVTKALAAAEPAPARPAPAPDPAPAATAVPAPPPAPLRPAPEWLEGSLDLTLLGFQPDAVFAPVLSVGGGIERRGIIARAAVGVAIGSAAEERVGLEASAFAGRRLPCGTELGGEVRYRVASSSASDPWLDQVLALGVRAARCPAALAGRAGQVCLHAALLPVGVRWRRGEVSGGEPVATTRTADWAASFLVGAAFRWPGVR